MDILKISSFVRAVASSRGWRARNTEILCDLIRRLNEGNDGNSTLCKFERVALILARTSKSIDPHGRGT